MTKPKRYTVTAALPYANGPLHIGHIAGAYLPADIYVRYLKLKGEDVKFICGSDEHGVPITLRAKNERKTPQEIVDRYHELNKTTFKKFGIDFDIYHRTSDKLHRETAQEFFLDLKKKGKLEEKETEEYYDEEAKQFLADRYIEGTCPNCGNERAYGDQCEKCGKSLTPQDLINPKSILSGKPLIKKKTTHWYLPLNDHAEWLKKWIDEKKGIWKTNVYGQCKSWLDQGLQPRAVTRDLDWGVPVPLPDAKGKVLYVWFDAPIGYISATKALTKDWEKYWKKQPDEADNAELIHFIGKDNIVFHCIIFPAMLKAEGTYLLPKQVPANEFLNLEGNKLSTSRNWAVWLHEYLEEFPEKEDVLRYVLCSTMPETKDSEFTWKDFQARNNNELVATLGNFVNRVMVLIHKDFDGIVPNKPVGQTNVEDVKLMTKIMTASLYDEYILGFKFREGLNEVMELARYGNKYLSDLEPWKLIKTDKARAGEVLYYCLLTIEILLEMLEPFLPFTSKKIVKMLNLDNGAVIKPGHKLNKPKLLFEKIEDDIIQKQIDKLHQSAPVSKEYPPVKPDVSFDEFVKQDLRVGKILTAEKVKGADKLLQLTVDLGFETRTIVSGIAEFFKPEEIIGKQVSVVVNLAPRKIKGILSQGMVLMAENGDGKLSFVSPSEQISEGSIIR